ncbi:DUF6624 domain-containing protein [Kordia algicida OT-1]|nr:DUF6624 domain-containing protein [Kordia algicida]
MLLFITIITISMNMESQNKIKITQLDYKELQTQLEAIRIEDQTLRQLLPEATAKFGADSDELKHIWKLIHKQDRINEEKVLHIIDTYGWLGKSDIGEMANQTLWLVIQHAAIDVQEKYLPQLEASVKKGASEGWHLAFLEDRIRMRKGKKQRYGTQAKKDKLSGITYIYPIENKETVNQRRKSIGLNTIEEYAKNNNYVIR